MAVLYDSLVIFVEFRNFIYQLCSFQVNFKNFLKMQKARLKFLAKTWIQVRVFCVDPPEGADLDIQTIFFNLDCLSIKGASFCALWGAKSPVRLSGYKGSKFLCLVGCKKSGSANGSSWPLTATWLCQLVVNCLIIFVVI